MNTSDVATTRLRTVLVDTTLLIQQQKCHADAQPVRSALRVYGFIGASSYSKLEFKRAWLQRLGYIMEVCEGASSVQEVLNTIKKRLGASQYKQRQLTTCIEQMVAFFDISDTPPRSPDSVRELRAHCRDAILSASLAYGRLITGEFRGTGCVRAEELPADGPGGLVNMSIRQCSPSKRFCQVDSFFRENVDQFQRIADRADRAASPSKELRGIREGIQAAKAAPDVLLDGKGCVRIADALIAIDGRKMDEFAANNDREWKVIAAALGKPLLNPVAGSGLGPEGGRTQLRAGTEKGSEAV